MSPLAAVLLLAGVLVGLVGVLFLLVRASRTKLPLGERPEGAPMRPTRRGVCPYCGSPTTPKAARCGECGAPLK